MLLDVFSARAC